jgi:HSP20 family molecular chaperone IbpA
VSIRDLEKLNTRQIETLQRKQTREVARLNEGHDLLKTEMKKGNDEELVDLQSENMRHLTAENEKKEKVLEQMKVHLAQTSKMTDTQIKDLKDNAVKVKQVEREKLSTERERVKSENDLYLEDLGYRFSKEHKKVANESQEQMRTLKAAKGEEISHNEKQFQDKINLQTNTFSERHQADGKRYKVIKDSQDKTFKTERVNTNIRQQQEMGKLTAGHTKVIEDRDVAFRKGIKEQDLIHEKKYNETLEIRNKDLKGLDELNTKVLTKMKTDLKETLETSVNRADDPFYRFTQLDPTMKQFKDHVEIAVKIPEHAKTDVQLTIHGKEAIINFNRRYDDVRQDAGMKNKLHKVESFTTRLMTELHLDPKTVKSEYKDGVMNYVITKA